jgi:hypothetical protein
MTAQSLLFHLASLSTTFTNRAPWLAHHYAYLILNVASPNLSHYDYFLVEKSLAAFAIFRGQCQDIPSAFQMVSVEVPKNHHDSVAAEQLPEHFIAMCSTSIVVHRRYWGNLPILVGSICRASSASVESSSCSAILLW